MPTFKERLLCGVASLALFDASGALAIEAPPSWAGFYVGGHAGYSWGRVSGDKDHSVLAPGTPFGVPAGTFLFAVPRDLDPSGGLAGIQAGYNFQSGNIVYGVEADLSWTGQRDTFDFSGRKTLFFEDFHYQETLAAKLRYMGTVRGRLGFALGNWLPYVTGGLAWGRMAMDLNWTLTQAFCPPCVASFSGSETRTLFGGAVGGGVAYALNDRWSLNAEYLYVDLGKKAYFSNVQGGGSFGLQDHIVKFGVSFRP